VSTHDEGWGSRADRFERCTADLERQLAEAQERGVFLWRTFEEWLLLQRIFGGSASEEHITNIERQLAEALNLLRDYVQVYPNNSGRTIRFLKKLGGSE
jgi:hypothetical protein